MPSNLPDNKNIANVLSQIADLLEVQHANPHRVRAYRTAASTLLDTNESIAKMYHEGGTEKLQSLPGIGKTLARIIEDYIRTGSSGILQRLHGEVSPEDVFTQVPGIGEVLAEKIVDQLDIHSLADLELAAHDGRLEQIDGFGDRRVKAVKSSLAGMLSPSASRRVRRVMKVGDEVIKREPTIEMLLQVDKAYRDKSEAGDLRKIAPKRFNPSHKAWLPIMHTDIYEWSLTALFSNTKRAHDLGKTHDWVVIYYERDGEENQATVVTETSGKLEGKRVVRGREVETLEYYERRSS